MTPAAGDRPPETEALDALVGKAHAVALRTAKLRHDFDGAHRLAQQAQAREAVVRTELTVALTAALAARAEAEARVRAQALAAYVARAAAHVRPLRPRSPSLDRWLLRARSPGHALILARSGVWRGTGRRLFDLRHMAAYARRGPNPAIQPPALFDQAWRLRESPDLAAARLAPLVHYLVAGAAEGRAPHVLFDEGWYRAAHAGEIGPGLSGLEHYVRSGAARGFSPHPLFDVAHYLAQGPALADGEDPLSHYLREGGAHGLSPHPLFDPAWYVAQAPEAAGGPALAHYLTAGSAAGLKPHPLVDPAWYRSAHPEVAEAGIEPLVHYVTHGAAQGWSPGPWFDLPHYVARRGAALAPGADPLTDYLRGGDDVHVAHRRHASVGQPLVVRPAGGMQDQLRLAQGRRPHQRRERRRALQPQVPGRARQPGNRPRPLQRRT